MGAATMVTAKTTLTIRPIVSFSSARAAFAAASVAAAVLAAALLTWFRTASISVTMGSFGRRVSWLFFGFEDLRDFLERLGAMVVLD